jgi:hypothetical protein
MTKRETEDQKQNQLEMDSMGQQTLKVDGHHATPRSELSAGVLERGALDSSLLQLVSEGEPSSKDHATLENFQNWNDHHCMTEPLCGSSAATMTSCYDIDILDSSELVPILVSCH